MQHFIFTKQLAVMMARNRKPVASRIINAVIDI